MSDVGAIRSKTRIQPLLDLAGDAIFIHTMEGQILDVNDAACKQLGYSREELTQLSFEKFENAVVNLNKRIENLIKDGQIFYEATFTRKDGRCIVMEINSTILEFDGKKAVLSIARDVSEKRKLEEQFRRNYGELEKNYRDLINSIDGIVWEADRVDLQFTFVSKKAEIILGYPLEDWFKRDFWKNHLHPEDKWVINYRLKAIAEKRDHELEYRMISADGRTVWLKDIVTVSKKLKLRGIMVDITERKRTETEYQKIDRALRTLSMCNQAIMFSKRESELLNEICRIIVEVGGYRFAWIGFAENDKNKSVRPVAYSGYEGGYLSNLNLTWRNTELGRGPTGTAIRTGKPSIAKNILIDPKFKPWRNEAIKRGFISSIALPLIVGGEIIGALNIYSDEEDVFEVGEVELLKKIANNLSFGIDALRERAIRKYVEKIRTKQQQRLEALWNIAKLVDAEERTLCDEIMAEITSMTHSKYAFYGFLNEDESVMTIYSWSKDTIKDCQIQHRPVEYPIARAGVWGDAVRKRRTVIVNDYKNYLNKKGTPDGHVQITRIMVVPIIRQNKIVALTGVANKLTEYTKEDAKQVRAFTTAIHAILERRKIEQSLKLSEEKYRTTFENTGTAMLIVEEDMTISLVNSELENLIGYKKEEIIGSKWNRFVHPDDLKWMEEYHFKRRNSTVIPKKYEFRLVDKNGNVKNVLITIDVIPGTSRSVVSLVDITQIKRLNNLLKTISEINEIVARGDDPESVLKLVCEKLNTVYDAVFVCHYKEDNLNVVDSRGIDVNLVKEAIRKCPSVSKAKKAEVVKIRGDSCKHCAIDPYKYILSLPLVQDRNYGIITIHSDSDFTEDEEELLKKLSSNIAFALSSYEVEESRKEAVEQLVTNLMQFDYSADRLRNPLAIIMSSLELRNEIGTEEVLKIIGEQAERIKKELDDMRKEEVRTHKLIEKNPG